MPVHNQTASTVMLAKSWLLTLDSSQVETRVPTESLRLWLTTLVDLGTPSEAEAVATGAARTVMGHTVRMAEAERSRG